METTGPEVVPQNGRQGEHQTGENTVEPCSGPCSSGTGLLTGAETGLGGVREPDSPNIQARVEHVSVDPFTEAS